MPPKSKKNKNTTHSTTAGGQATAANTGPHVPAMEGLTGTIQNESGSGAARTVTSRPQRQSKTKALNNKVWQADIPSGTRRKRTISESAGTGPSPTAAQPVKKAKVTANLQHGKTGKTITRALGGTPASARPTRATKKPVAATPVSTPARSVTRARACPAPTDLEMHALSEEELPLADVKNVWARAASAKKGGLEVGMTREATHANVPNRDPGQEEEIASEHGSEYSYTADEDDEEAFSEDDDLGELEHTDDEGEALQNQLAAEQPFWNEENENSGQGNGKQRARVTLYTLPDGLESMDEEEEQEAAERLIQLATTPASASKASVLLFSPTGKGPSTSRTLLETPVWKCVQHSSGVSAAEAAVKVGGAPTRLTSLPAGGQAPPPTPHAPGVAPTMAALAPPATTGRSMNNADADEDDDDLEEDELTNDQPFPDVGEPHDLPGRMYVVVRPPTAGAVLSLNAQHPHVRNTLRDTFNTIERDLYFRHAFPDAIRRFAFVADALRDAAADLGHHGLRARFATDDAFTRALGTLPSQRISSFRGNIKTRSDASVVAFYGLNAPQCAQKVAFLFDHLAYIYPHNYDAERRTVSWSRPYQHECVTAILQFCFFKGPTSFAVRAQDMFTSLLTDRPEEKEIPVAMLALVGTVIHASLTEYRTGAHRPMPFSADGYIDVYNEHVIILNTIRNQNPRGFHTMMHRLFKHASGIIETPETLSTNALDHIDIAAMDVD